MSIPSEMAQAEETTLEALYERYGHEVYRRCRYLLGSDDAAWDAVLDVFLKVDRARDGFRRDASWLTWLMRITTNHCLNVLRAGRVRQGAGLLAPEALDHEGRCEPAVAERAAQVRGVLELFDPKTQAAAIHYWVDEMSQEEVAAAVGLSVPTVRKRLREFVRRARRELERSTPLPAAGRT